MKNDITLIEEISVGPDRIVVEVFKRSGLKNMQWLPLVVACPITAFSPTFDHRR